MTPAAMNAVHASVRNLVPLHAEAFVSTLEEEDPHRSLEKSFNLDMDLTGERALKPGASVWIPGCDARWAVMTALQFRNLYIVASDANARTLETEAALAEALQIRNIEFRWEDPFSTSYVSEFDFVSAVGLSHAPDALEHGLTVIARALKPTGLLELAAPCDVLAMTQALIEAKLSIRAWKNVSWSDVQDPLELFVEHTSTSKRGSRLNHAAEGIRDRTVRASIHGVRHHFDALGRLTRSEGFAKVDFFAGEPRFDGGERRPAISQYGAAIDRAEAGERRTHMLPVRREIVEAIVEAAWRPVTIGEIASQLTRHRVIEASERDVVRVCDQLCRPPFRVLVQA